MIDALVFSKDRGCQLDLLLRSIDQWAPDLYSNVTVLYTASSRDMMRGYGGCFAEHAGVRFVLEHDFEQQTRQWIRRAGNVISFLVDDDVFFDRPPPAERIGELLEDAGVSLRGGDYDYPFSLDGNVYRNRDVQLLAANPFYGFRNPNEFEHAGHLARERLPFACVLPVKPCLVGMPLNRVSKSSGMPHLGVDAGYLNAMYVHGRRLALPVLEGPQPVHLEAVELAWSDGTHIEIREEVV